MELSWIPKKKELSWLQGICAQIIKTGPMPKHVAFIMDGNRRFASKTSIDQSQGHIKGFIALTEVLNWCHNLGITEVTVYAFSIDNFKRSKEEVDCLMGLARERFKRLLQEKEELLKNEVCIRVFGNLSLLPKDIRENIAEIVTIFKNNSRNILNICIAYSSQEEITCVLKEVTEAVQLGLIKTSDIDEEVLQNCMYSGRSPNPDLVVRTSGEVRLSGFLAWQSSFSCLSFLNVLWPEFSIWHLFLSILQYQRSHDVIQEAVNYSHEKCESIQLESDYRCVHKDSENVHNCPSELNINRNSKELSYTRERKERVSSFLSYLYSKRDTYIENLCPKSM
ncbi:dehydrodolichyl diphosphate synthase complex subunit DHDDS [Octopus sinensis]|uniref:Alkyl transferase n=1 Tax=Octopus sinensis TaxID=2607531 RepID=A0A6P7TDR1_9MOLL|nr:dehydrodolichyl diphosphate synthase complex subunit DHDDS [Octopus sinensis]XP_029649255.1 dehydrodolichyl diphosphate synthase complex subunit DHDDS [Octopus sinensis]XP_036367957.1 dehydrodolichyl diphosphate synthase complex subunit DHDDS [Octopus sinensis]